MENEWLAADLVQLARKNPVAAEVEIAEILNNLCTSRGLHARVRRAWILSGICDRQSGQ